MELWIRSQDREILIKVNRIGFEEFDNGYGIVTYKRTGTENEFGLGLYKTKERALEVLDEIQRIVNGDDLIERLGNKGNMLNVFPNLFYQMPQE